MHARILNELQELLDVTWLNKILIIDRTTLKDVCKEHSGTTAASDPTAFPLSNSLKITPV